MAIIKVINSKANIGKAIDYITKDEKTEKTLIDTKDCNATTAVDEMKATKEIYRKSNGRQYVHVVQSFNPKDRLEIEQAHTIGQEFMYETEKFQGHQIVMATHLDKKHIHNHFIVNSVNYQTGEKYHSSKQDLQELKDISNKLSKEHGLTLPTKKGDMTSFNQKKYRVIEKGIKGEEKSYLLETAKEVKESLKKATDKESFIEEMKKKGYGVNWHETRNYITFTTPEGHKLKSTNLEKTFKDSIFSALGIEN